MYIIQVETCFNAMHSVHLPSGEIEPSHGHDWRVRVRLASPELNDTGMVADFVQLQQKLENIAAALHHGDLNAFSWPGNHLPTAEVIARWFFDRMVEAGFDQISEVEVREAPGCVAFYRRDSSRHPLAAVSRKQTD